MKKSTLLKIIRNLAKSEDEEEIADYENELAENIHAVVDVEAFLKAENIVSIVNKSDLDI